MKRGVIYLKGPDGLGEAAAELLDDAKKLAVVVDDFVSPDGFAANIGTALHDHINQIMTPVTEVVGDWLLKSRIGGLSLCEGGMVFDKEGKGSRDWHIDTALEFGNSIRGPLSMSLGRMGTGRWHVAPRINLLDENGVYDSRFHSRMESRNSGALRRDHLFAGQKRATIKHMPGRAIIIPNAPFPAPHRVSRASHEKRRAPLYDYRCDVVSPALVRGGILAMPT